MISKLYSLTVLYFSGVTPDTGYVVTSPPHIHQPLFFYCAAFYKNNFLHSGWLCDSFSLTYQRLLRVILKSSHCTCTCLGRCSIGCTTSLCLTVNNYMAAIVKCVFVFSLICFFNVKSQGNVITATYVCIVSMVVVVIFVYERKL